MYVSSLPIKPFVTVIETLNFTKNDLEMNSLNQLIRSFNLILNLGGEIIFLRIVYFYVLNRIEFFRIC